MAQLEKLHGWSVSQGKLHSDLFEVQAACTPFIYFCSACSSSSSSSAKMGAGCVALRSGKGRRMGWCGLDRSGLHTCTFPSFKHSHIARTCMLR